MVKRPGEGAAPIAQARRSMSRFTAMALLTRPRSGSGQEPVEGGVARQCMAATKTSGRLVLQQRHVGDEVASGELQLHDGPVTPPHRNSHPDRWDGAHSGWRN